MFQLTLRLNTIARPTLLAESSTDTDLRRRMCNLLRQRRAEYQDHNRKARDGKKKRTPAAMLRITQAGEHCYRFPNGSLIQLRYAAPSELTARKAA